MRETFGVYCAGERKVIGTVEFEVGKKADATQFLNTFKVLEVDPDIGDKYRYRDPEGKLRTRGGQPLVKDRIQTTCGRCGNAVLLVEKKGEGYDITGGGVYFVPGTMSIGKRKKITA